MRAEFPAFAILVFGPDWMEHQNQGRGSGDECRVLAFATLDFAPTEWNSARLGTVG